MIGTRWLSRSATAMPLVLLAGGLFAQVPVPTPRPVPNRPPPRVGNGPKRLPKRILDKRRGKKPAKTTLCTPSKGGDPRPGGVKIKPGRRRAADRLLKSIARRWKTVREEKFEGTLRILDPRAGSRTLRLMVRRRRAPDGTCHLILRHERPGGLPPLGYWAKRDAAGLIEIRRYTPESRRWVTLADPLKARLAESSLRIMDLLPLNLGNYRATFAGEGILDGHPTSEYQLLPIKGAYPWWLVVRRDNRVVARLSEGASAGAKESGRSLSFDGWRLFGVQQRWGRILATEPKTGRSCLLVVKGWILARGKGPTTYAPEDLLALFGL